MTIDIERAALTPTLSTLVAALRAALGDGAIVTEPERLVPYLREWRGHYQGAARVVVRPADTAGVSVAVAACTRAGVAVVPMGGNSGLVGGAVSTEDQVILSTDRLTRIRSVDPDNSTITVESGVILQDVQRAAAEVDRLFPLSLGAEGTCRIGGNLSTNAGGVGVLRYGNTRDLTLGLEVVLPDGQVWEGLTGLRKNNTGYDLKHLFVGAEGTLGIITAAVLKLFPKPKQIETAWIAVPSPQAGLDLLTRARAGSGDQVTACELMPRIGVEYVLRHSPGTTDPLDTPTEWYVLLELTSPVQDAGLRHKLEAVLEAGFADGLILDATIAANDGQRRALWRLREDMSDVQKYEGGSIKHDVAVPVARTGDFIARATAACLAVLPDVRPVAFGHLGDGNIHFNLSQPAGPDPDGSAKAAFMARYGEVNRIVHDIVVEMGGTISAEHGIGMLKRAELAVRKSPVELAMMRAIKAALDPKGLMNPGKVI